MSILTKIENLNQSLEIWANTDPENKNKTDKIQKEIVEIRNKITDYPIELVNLSKSIKSLKKKEEYIDNYETIEEYLNLFKKYHIKYDKEINLINPNTDEIIKNIWEIKEKEYSKKPKYDAGEIKRIIRELYE